MSSLSKFTELLNVAIHSVLVPFSEAATQASNEVEMK